MADETFGEAVARLRREAGWLGAVHVEAGLDQLEARVGHEREKRLREAWGEEGNDVAV